MSKLAYRRDIDGLRCLAVVPVVLGHAGFSFVPGGFIGVDLFFVISGYLITTILVRELQEGRFSLIRFYERRARRILPALFAVLLACLAVGWFILLPDEYGGLGSSVMATLLFVSNIYFWRSKLDYFGTGVAYEPLLHTWSLAVEEQFYLFFPLLLWLLVRGRNKGNRRRLIGALGAVCALSFILSVIGSYKMPTSTFYLLPARCWELGMGALLAVGAFPRLGSGPLRLIVGAAGLAMIVAGMALISDHTPFPGLAAVPPVLGATFLIWAGSEEQEGANRLLGWKPFVWIGLISYSLYLWHWPVIVAARLIEGQARISLGAMVWTSLLSVLLGWLSWRFVEQPFRRPDSGLRLPGNRVLAFSAAGIAAIASFGLAIWALDGMTTRLDQKHWSAYQASLDPGPFYSRCLRLDGRAVACEFGAEQTGERPDFVVWGDSHAASLLAGFDASFRDKGLSGVAFTRAACPPLLDISQPHADDQAQCGDFNAAVFDIISGEYRGVPVILAARWAFVVEGLRPEGEAGGPMVLARKGAISGSMSENATLVRESLDRELAVLRDGGHALILIDTVPEPGFNVPRGIARHDWLGWQMPVRSREQTDARNRRAREILDEMALRHDAVLVDVASLFCTDTCSTHEGERSFYLDEHHLNMRGADRVAAQFASVVSATHPSLASK